MSDLRQKWIAALRSGDFKQGRGLLGNEMKGYKEYCCLGVLVEVSDIPKSWEDNGFLRCYGTFDDADGNPINYSSSPSCIPVSLRNAVGLSCMDADKLMHMNDVEKATFEEIANYLEEKTNDR